MSKPIALKPRISEKAYGLSKEKRVYVFDVPLEVNRLSVAEAVSTQFKVNVAGVNVAVIKGKKKRTYRKSGRSVTGQRSNVKKAYVTLKDGDSIPIFAQEKEAEAKQAKKDKRAKK